MPAPSVGTCEVEKAGTGGVVWHGSDILWRQWEVGARRHESCKSIVQLYMTRTPTQNRAVRANL